MRTRTFKGNAYAEYIAKREAAGDVFSIRIDGRKLEVDDVITIKGERGTFQFKAARVVNGEVQWIQVFGGAHGHYPGKWRHFPASKIGSKKRALTNEVKGAL